MILGVGCDILMVSRIDSVYRKFGDKFLDRLLTDNEKKLFHDRNDCIYTLAKLFSAKEAVFKSIGSLVQVMKPREIEITHNSMGVPSVVFYGTTASIIPCSTAIHLSISDEIDYVVSYSVSCV